METISMSSGERQRLVLLAQVAARTLSLRDAAGAMRVSYRQAKRLWARYQAEGDAGVVHRLRGRPSNRQAEPGLRERTLELFREKYSDYGPTLAAERLARDDGIEVPRTTLARWLTSAGLWERKRRRKTHRRRRARREKFGELVQMDGSYHDWFEGRRGWAVLMVMIDDATGAIDARFHERESLESAYDMFRHYTLRHGLPRALYVDRAGIYRSEEEPTEAQILAGIEPRTQFGRAMDELGVELILARSPQAKGRVERVNGTLQDRLVKALRRAGISDLAAANALLEREYLAEFNAQFAKPPQQRGDAHRPVKQRDELERALSVVEPRVVQNDWTIRWKNRFLQLPEATAKHVQPKQSVEVRQQFDGRLRIFTTGGQELPWEDVRARVERPRKRPSRGGPTGSAQGQKPVASHPWRRSLKPPQGRPPDVAAADGCCVATARSARLRDAAPVP